MLNLNHCSTKIAEMSYKISIEKTTSSHIGEIDFNDLPFGKNFSDHMFIADYYDGDWHDCRVIPFQDFSLHPATSAIHYGQAIFEGLKAEKNPDGEAIVFRPLKNWNRLNISAERMAMPAVPQQIFMDALDILLSLDKDWIPTAPDSSLYIRPFLFATEKFVGIRVAEHYRFCIFTCPVGAYYNKPVKVFINERYVRAAPGGVGFAKAAGNYGAAMMPASEVQKKGYDQLLWLDGIHHRYIQEIGTMNIFFVIDGVLVTPGLELGTILNGITRDSVLQLAADFGYPVEIRDITIDEVIEAHKAGKLTDMFGCGTAAVVSHIGLFHFQGVDYELPAIETRNRSNQLKKRLIEIKSGLAEDTHGWLHKVKELVPVM